MKRKQKVNKKERIMTKALKTVWNYTLTIAVILLITGIDSILDYLLNPILAIN